MLGEGQSRLGRAHGATCPVQELDSELLLELADRLRERRLRHVQPGRRPAEMELLDHCEEVAKVSELDGDRISGRS